MSKSQPLHSEIGNMKSELARARRQHLMLLPQLAGTRTSISPILAHISLLESWIDQISSSGG